MRGLGHLRFISKHPLWLPHWLWVINIILQMMHHLVLQLVVLKLEWVLEQTNLPPINIIVGLMLVILCHLWVGIIHIRLITINTGSLIHYIRGGAIILLLIAVVEVAFLIVPTTSTPRMFIFTEIGMLCGLCHLRVIEQHPTWSHHPVSIIKLVLMVVLSLLLHQVVLNVVLVLVSPTLPPIQIIVGFMAMTLCHL